MRTLRDQRFMRRVLGFLVQIGVITFEEYCHLRESNML